MNTFIENELVDNLKNIGNQLEKSNRIAILDRLLANGSMTEESYVEELKELLKK